MSAKTDTAIRFEVCDNKDNVVVVKRILPGENTRSKYAKEMSLPKIEIQCLDKETIEHFLSLQDVPFSTEYKPIISVTPVTFKSLIRTILKRLNYGKSCFIRR